MNLDQLAFAQLLRTRGEPVTFRDKKVMALVNRLPKVNNPPGNIEVTTRRGSTIQFPLTVTTPEQNDIATDVFGINHRLDFVQHIGHCWQCECEAT